MTRPLRDRIEIPAHHAERWREEFLAARAELRHRHPDPGRFALLVHPRAERLVAVLLGVPAPLGGAMVHGAVVVLTDRVGLYRPAVQWEPA